MAKTSTIECPVPGCDKSWFLSGKAQGFVKSGAFDHISAHWWRYHEKEGHKPQYANPLYCRRCRAAGPKGLGAHMYFRTVHTD